MEDLELSQDWTDMEAGEGMDEAPETKADQPAEPEEAEADQGDQMEAGADQGAREEAEAAETFEIKHLDEVRRVDREEVVRLAQKGMDYDRVRAELRRLENNVFENFVHEMAREQSMDTKSFMEETKARILARREKLDLAVARERVKRSQLEDALAEKDREDRRRAEEEKKQAEIRTFLRRYRDVDPKDIPREVWVEVSQGERLADAYARYENRRLKDQVAALKQRAEVRQRNSENSGRSTGSQKSAGKRGTDPYAAAWYGEDD